MILGENQTFASPEEALVHFGVKGMRWGQRKVDGPAGVPHKINKTAKSDAEEFTKAKLFYGEGAGTRRKLIKAKVEERSKHPLYKKAFDHHVNKTDLAQRAKQATKQRKRTDRTKAVKKTGKGVGHVVRGNSQYANTAAIGAVAAVTYAHQTGLTKKAANAGKTFVDGVLKTR